MMKKYEQLIKMLVNNGYNVDEFCELGTEYSAMVGKKDLISCIYLSKNYIEVTAEVITENEFVVIEERCYKTSKGAYNFIVKHIGN